MATEENGNYSKIPNAFIHNLISANLSASEIEIALYVARLTFGFHEESKIISLTSFQKATGHTRWTVWNAIESLVRKCVLVRKSIPSGSEYRINKEFASTEMRTSTEKHTSTSTENPTKVVRKSVPVKERLKEIEKKDSDGSVSTHGVVIDETETETLKPKTEKIRYLENVFLTQDEYEKLVKQYGQKKTESMINNLNAYIGSKGKKYKSHYYTMLVWENKNGQEKHQTEQPVIRNAAGQPLEYIKWDDDPRNKKNAK